MKFSLRSNCSSCDTLVLLFHKGETLSKEHNAWIKDHSNLVKARWDNKEFEGESGQSLVLYTEKGPLKRIVLVGQGEKEKALPQALENLGAKVARTLKSIKSKHAAIVIADEDLEEFGNGVALANYEFTFYKKADPKAVRLEEVSFLTKATKSTQNAVENLRIFAEASGLTRDLINTCSGDLNTQDLTQKALAVAKKYKMKATVLDEKKLKKLGCGGLIGVGQGATVGPRMVLIEHRYKSTAKQPNLAYIGKGIVFDSGGMNLKPSGHIEDMKLDMTGAATVLGALQSLAERKVPGYFLGVLCIAENAISDRAVHPGDVLKMFNGKTVEITNTDAEGRLVLADGLAYTEKNYKPKAMIDIATLTGAVTVALGYTITGVLGNDEAWIQKTLDAAKATHERAWPLPLDEDFVKATKGDFSDLKNATDGVRAGTIMGAAFLKNFVEKTPWIHLDVAGTSWAERPTPTTSYGATAASLRTLVELGVRSA